MAQLTVPRSRRMVIAMKEESVYGTDAFGGAYLAADIIPCFDIAPDLRMDEIMNLSMAGDIGRLPSIMGIETAQVAFSMFARGAGAVYAAGVKPEMHIPLQAATLIGTGSFGAGVETWTYQPGTPRSHTIYVVQENGRTLKMVGCLGTVGFSMRAGGVCQARFTFQGKVGGVADVAFVAGTISGTPGYPVIKSAAFQIGAANYAPRIASVGVELGNTLSPVPSINDVTGLVGYFVSDRNPRVSIDPEADTVANRDWYTAMKNGTLEDMSFQVGTVQYNKLKFQFGAALGSQMQVVANSFGTRDGLTSYPTQLLATISAGGDDIALVFA